MSQIKVCQFSSSYPPVKDGVGDFAAKLNRIFLRNGLSASVITADQIDGQSNIFNYFKNYSFPEILRSIKFLRKEKITTIIFHYPTTFYGRKILISLIPPIYRLAGFKVILYLHEFSAYSLLGKLRIFPMLISVSRIITTDNLHLAAIRKIYKKNNVSVIPGGINFVESDFLDHKICCEIKEKLSLAYFGFIKKGKGLDVLIDLFDDSSEITQNYSLSVIGSVPDNFNDEDESLLNEIKNNRHISYLGYLNAEELKTELGRNNFMILPFNDGLTEKRGSFMTAMAIGLPVITTKPKIPIKDLKHGHNVLFIDELSEKSILNTLENVKNISIAELEQLGKKAREWYLENHSEDILFNKIKKLL